MDQRHAAEIAHLLNTQNQLEIHYDASLVLAHADDYLVDLSEDGRVACCAQLKRVQWYQSEICHVTTNPDFARKGRGLRIVASAEDEARKQGARLVQSTIRSGNIPSEGLFEKAGFVVGASFTNPNTGNVVRVWSKSLYPSSAQL